MEGVERNKKKSVLYWFIRNNSIPPSSSRSFQDAVLLILHFRTLTLFQTVSSSTFIMSDVRSICFPISIQDWYREVKFWATGRQYSFFLWILWTKTIRILIRSTWMQRAMHNTCIKHGRDIRTQCIGSTSFLLLRKDWSSIRHDCERYHSFLNTPSLLYSESC